MLADAPDGAPDVLLLATGSEVSLCPACERLAAEGIGARVVSLLSWELFEEQSRPYRDGVLPPEVPARVAVEEARRILAEAAPTRLDVHEGAETATSPAGHAHAG